MSLPDTASPHGLRIFLVEDHPDTLHMLSRYLLNAGHEVCHATTMSEALQAIPEASCDVLISDLGLPDGDGWELLTRLKDENLPHPGYAIAVSGFGSASDRIRSQNAGYRHHVLKPFPPRMLMQYLGEAQG